MKARRAQRPDRGPGGAARTAPDPIVLPAPLSHPLVWLALAATLTSVLLSVSYVLFDPDLFQHLLVGRVIWETRGVPQQHLWTWAHYGNSEVLPSWLFRGLLYPFWALGEVPGLFVWRWLTAAGAFAAAWLTARRLGARGLLPLLVVAVCALPYRDRSMLRPETLAILLLAVQIWIHETRRQGGRDASPWLIGVALIWANAHISYHLGIWLQVIYAVDAWLTDRARRRRAAPGASPPAGRQAARLWWILLASVLASFVNPFGWQALWQPFHFILYWRNEPIYRAIGELQPLTLERAIANRFLFVFAAWWLIVAWRAVGRRVDRVEIVLALFFTALLAGGQRFVGFFSIAAVPFIARGLSYVLAGRRPAPGVPLALRAAGIAAAVVLVGLPTWARPGLPLGIRLDPRYYAEAALDFMAGHDVRGRGFASFELAGYQLYRFWPERDRLPFMDIHPESATPRERFLYTQMLFFPEGWTTLDRENRFDYALLSRQQVSGNVGLDALDRDTSFALVFVDDVAALYVRRGGPLGGVAERFGYRLAPGGAGRLSSLQRMCQTDSAGCDRLVAELERAAAGSPRNADARSLLANVAMMRGDYRRAREELERGLEVNPSLLRARERLGMLALAEGDPRAALALFEAERRRNGSLPGLDLRIGSAHLGLGNRDAAARHFRREVQRTGSAEAADSLAAMETR